MRLRDDVIAGCASLMVLVLVLGLVLAGCGGSSVRAGSSSAADGALSSHSSAASSSSGGEAGVSTSLPAVRRYVSIPGLLFPGNRLPKHYTCDGTDVSPSVRWSGVPRDAVELAVFVIGLRPVAGR